ncbi:hypothetical protein X739_32895 [Mesorhizobium sp. LNHC220B00]|nr:hypothetical protein X739_32895 [Mesorhizobium sp. LNHC220B00]
MRAWVAKPAFPVDTVTIVSTVILFHVSMMICFHVDMETRRQRRKEAPMIISAAIPKGGTGKSTLLRTLASVALRCGYYLTAAEQRQFQLLAISNGHSMTELLRKAVQDYIRIHRHKLPKE